MDASAQVLNNSNMATSRKPATADRDDGGLPTYALYGETGGGLGVDWLHCESIASRSQLHAWEIRPHRHATLFQILYIESGQGQAQVDGARWPLAGPALLWVPPPVVHGFQFEPGIDGCVLTVLRSHLERLVEPLGGLGARLAAPGLLQADATTRAPTDGNGPAGDHGAADDGGNAMAARAARALRDEFLAPPAPWREAALDAALLRLLIGLGRAEVVPPQAVPTPQARPAAQALSTTPATTTAATTTAPGPAAGGDRARRHVARFRALIEARFREQPPLSDYAAALAITPTQLNRVCRAVLGHGALDEVHRRLLLEAQRDLAYTQLTIQQIAHGLGFGDAGYFSRFFVRGCGMTPSAWRALRRR